MGVSVGNLRIAGNNAVTKALNIIMPLAGAGVMFYYEYCETSCSFLAGTFMGVDLKIAGIIFMGMLLATTFAIGEFSGNAMNGLRTFMISSAVGAEFILIRFQIVNDIFCQFCLVFAGCVFVLFAGNFSAMNKKLMLLSLAAGLVAFIFFFEGQVVPLFDLSLL
jgi:hypothetical protein